MASIATTAQSRVLIVEDEPLLRMLAVDVIEAAGLESVQAGDATEALEVLEERNDIGIVFTDVNLPGSIDGLKLAAVIRDRWPRIALMITSGKVVPRRGDIPVGCRYFSKPYDVDQIITALKGFTH